jgi:ferredoxin
MKHKIIFNCEADGLTREAEAEHGELLTQVAYRAGVTIQQTCGGTPSCTDCKVRVLKGFDDAFGPPEGPEIRLLGNVFFITKERLACQAKVTASSTIFVPRPPPRKEKILKKPQNESKKK